MAKLVLKDKIVDQIKTDQVLYGKVAFAMDLTIRSMFDVLRKENASERLATATVLQVLRDHLKITQDGELLEEVTATAA